MSPDDAIPTETEPAGDAVETKPKKSLKERMAFMNKGGEKMEKVPVLNKVPKSMRLLVVIIILVVVIAAISVGVMMRGGDDKTPPDTNKINPAKLEDFNWPSPPQMGTASEFGQTQWALETMIEGNGTILVDSISMTLEWQDEPDQTWAGRNRENSPDSFQLRIDIGGGNFSIESPMTPNDAGSKQGSVSLDLDMASTNFTYVLLGNATDMEFPEDVFDLPIDLYIIMGEAGDLYASGPAAFKLNDTGNDYTLTVTVGGKVIPDDSTQPG
jgi:hypothetical protein